ALASTTCVTGGYVTPNNSGARRLDVAPGGEAADAVEEVEHGVVEAVRRLDHEPVGGAAQLDQLRVRDHLGELLGVADGGERVLRARDHERGNAHVAELEAQLV